MRKLIRAIFHLVAFSGIGALLFRLSGRRTRVLMYHGVCAATGAAAPFGGRGKHVPASTFERQMRWLRRHARPLSLDDLVSVLEAGDRPPARSVVVTLDDGYRNNHEQALPTLKRYAVPAIVYVTTGFVEGRPLWVDRIDHALEHATGPSVTEPETGIAWSTRTPADRRTAAAHFRGRGKRLFGAERERLVKAVAQSTGADLAEILPDSRPEDTRALDAPMIRTMKDEGIAIGSHTVNHEILSRCDDHVLHHELNESRRWLERGGGLSVEHFAYPNGAVGDFDARTEIAVRAAGYRSAVLTVQGVARKGCSPFQIPRLPVNGDEGMGEFIATICGLRSTLSSLRRRLLRGS